jgi:LuxR family transcriptional activator of bioluminescence operon
MNLRGTHWVKRIPFAISIAGLKEIIEVAIDQLGFRYFLYRGYFPYLRTGLHEILLHNCPEEWSKFRPEYELDTDPLRRRARQAITPILWHELVPYEPAWIARARKFGLATGVTQPVHGPGGQLGSFSFIKNRGGSQAEREIWAALAKCQLMTGFVHEAVERITKNQVGSVTNAEQQDEPLSCGLTERERQCLIWTAAGKTTSGVATLLGLADRTVIFHLSNARRKLGAVNSHHAIMRAISLGQIKAA